MRVSPKVLRLFIPDQIMENAGLKNAFKMANTVARYYCTPMTIANKCPLKCTECEAKLRQPVDRLIKDRNIIKTPMGAYIYTLRNLFNSAVETKPVNIEAPKDRFGIPIETEGTVWDRLLASL
jgi:hypothetical protein